MKKINLTHGKVSNVAFGLMVVLFMALMVLQSHTTQQQPKTITLTLTIEQAETVLGALAKLPYETSAPLIQVIQQQAYSQLQPKTDTIENKKQPPKKN
jgi:hypothetical protein